MQTDPQIFDSATSENLLHGLTILGKVPVYRPSKISKHLTKEDKSLFIIRNLTGENLRVNKVISRGQGMTLDFPETAFTIISDQRGIANALGLTRLVF